MASADQHPDVEVLVQADWHPGHVRGWWRPHGEWVASVTWSDGHGRNHLDVFEMDQVRQLRYCPWWRGNRECFGWDNCPNYEYAVHGGPGVVQE